MLAAWRKRDVVSLAVGEMTLDEWRTVYVVLRNREAAILSLLKQDAGGQPPQDGWRSMDSVPKGTKIIAGYYNQLGKWRTVMGAFYPAGTLESDEADSGFAEEGWYEQTETHDELLRMETPTHWQPLPSPPSAENAQSSTERVEENSKG